MSVTLSLFAGAGAQFLDNSGNVLTGGLIYTYNAGTTTPLATYTSNLGNTEHPNPIVLDAAGRIPGGEIWLTTGFGYKFVTKDSNNVLIGTYDNVPSSSQPPIVNDASSISYEGGNNIVAGNFIIGQTYLITSIGSTNFQLIGASANTVGILFIATGVGSGTGTAQYSRTVQAKFKDIISVKDFGAIGNGVNDDTVAIQTALNQTSRRVFFPAGQYKITSTLTIYQDAILEGDGGSGELGSSNITVIQVTGDFDAFKLYAPTITSYYGYLTIKRITIDKIGGTARSNNGLYIANFAPNVILENVYTINFNNGFKLYFGIAQINACVATNCNIGFNVFGTSFVIQNCYAKNGNIGYQINDQTVYSTLISCASDNNSVVAYKFLGTTGPFVTDGTSSLLRLQNCGAESCGQYMYVDGNFDIEVVSPSVANITGSPTFAYLESAKRLMVRDVGSLGNLNWLDFNQAKCNPDVVIVEGDMPHYTNVTPPDSAYPNLPIAQVDFKTLMSSPANLGLAKTRIPSLTYDPGASSGTVSTVEKGIFVTQATSAHKLRVTSNVLSNSFMATAQITYSAMNTSGAGDAGGQIYLCVSNTGGINAIYTKTSADITVAISSGPTNGAPYGGTYTYFDISSSYDFNYLWDITAYVNFEVLPPTVYNNWSVSLT